MDALIDEVLETLLHSAIWRSTAHLSLTSLIIVAIVVFLVLAYRRSRKSKTVGPVASARRKGFRYRSRYRK